ncbi:MAG TPA: HAD-IIIC family phosphatase [Azospirillaceae bacterium]|nr:HAD-IIIC family phosphatase [Azospirillaceae bacterium]
MTAPSPAPHPTALHWLPPVADFPARIAEIRTGSGTPADKVAKLTALAGHRIDFIQTAKLDRLLRETLAAPESGALALPRLRLAVLATHTADHLLPAVRVAALRRGLVVETWLAPYGQVRQAVLDPSLGLDAFRPDAVLLLLDAEAAVPALPLDAPADEAQDAVAAQIEGMAALWQAVRQRLKAQPIQATVPDLTEPLFGHAESGVPTAPGAMVEALNTGLRAAAARARVPVFDLDRAARRTGLDVVSDPRLWFHAKQLIHPAAGPWFGDQLARVLAALRGLSRKVLVLDLDNTLWGGVIGDDGLTGIVLGQGTAEGEAYRAFQHYCKRLRERGVLLAVSSKNEPATAEAPFTDHPEMVLRRADIAAFEANWDDKPAAVQRIARDLDLGLDSLVFFDDNPAERDLMRRTLPQVAVPEVPDSPDQYVRCLADAGYFESIGFTADDARRAEQYAANAERRRVQAQAADLDGFLRGLEMRLEVRPFDRTNLARIAQLINKTNQFNLTTRRRTEAEVEALLDDPDARTFHARVGDKFGDNGIVAVVIGRCTTLPDGAPALDLDTWLMSCRVLGRKVEDALMDVVADTASREGLSALIGRYRPTPRNGMVAEFYPRLGFEPFPGGLPADGESVWIQPLAKRADSGARAFFAQVSVP